MNRLPLTFPRALALSLSLIGLSISSSVTWAQPTAQNTLTKPAPPALPQWGDGAINSFLTAELLALDKQFEPAATTLWPLARYLKDPVLFERVVQWAMQAKRMDLAFSAAAQWELADPTNAKAQQMADGILLINNRFTQFATRLTARYAAPNVPAEQELAYLQRVGRTLSLSPEQNLTLYKSVIDATKPHQTLGSVQYTLSQLAVGAKLAKEAQEHMLAASLASPPSIQAIGGLLLSDPTQAVNSALQWTVAAPNNPAAWRTLGLVYGQSKQTEKAAQAFSQAIKLTPSDVTLHLEHMEQLRSLGQTGAARESLLTAYSVRSSITSHDAARLLAEALEDDYHLAQASTVFELALKLPSTKDNTQITQAKLLALRARQGDAASLRSLLAIQASADEGSSDLLTRITLSTLRELGQYEQSLAMAENLPDNEIAYEQALSYELMGQYQRSESLLRDALSRNPNAAHLLNTLGYGLVDRNLSPASLAEGTAMLEAALKASPNSAAIMDSLGWAYFRAKQYSKAQPLLQKAYDLKRDPEVAAHLGELLYVTGNQQQARRLWSQALAIDPKHKILNNTLKRLNIKF